MLRLVTQNTDEDIKNYKLDNQVEYWACRRCKHRWTATLEQMSNDPTCRKCGK